VVDYANTPYARDARVLKAVKIEATLRMIGCDATTAAALDDKGRRDAEKAAGVRKSSDETWAVVLTLMGASNPRTPVTCPACGQPQGDPAICHHCDGVIGWSAWQDARTPATRFCSEVCANAHLVGCT